MAGTDSQSQLFTLIRNFTNEKSLGERRVSNLKRRILELQPVLDAANDEKEKVKRSKEISEQELRASEVELALTEASIQAQQSRISLLQQEMSKFGAELAYLKPNFDLCGFLQTVVKKEEAVSRERFISKLYEVNREIRNFHERMMELFHNAKLVEGNDGTGMSREGSLEGVEYKLAFIRDQICNKEQECREDKNIHKEFLYELASLEKRVPLTEVIVKESELQELSWQTAESEQLYASHVEELRSIRVQAAKLTTWETWQEFLQLRMLR